MLPLVRAMYEVVFAPLYCRIYRHFTQHISEFMQIATTLVDEVLSITSYRSDTAGLQSLARDVADSVPYCERYRGCVYQECCGPGYSISLLGFGLPEFIALEIDPSSRCFLVTLTAQR